MGRSGYTEGCDLDQWSLIMYRGAVKSAMKGKRGQAFLKDLLAALDALPEPKLIADELKTEDGAVCAIGALGKVRGVNMEKIDPEDSVTVANTFDIAEALAREVVFENDQDFYHNKETPEQRFVRMREWVVSQIRPLNLSAASVSSDHRES